MNGGSTQSRMAVLSSFQAGNFYLTFPQLVLVISTTTTTTTITTQPIFHVRPARTMLKTSQGSENSEGPHCFRIREGPAQGENTSLQIKLLQKCCLAVTAQMLAPPIPTEERVSVVAFETHKTDHQTETPIVVLVIRSFGLHTRKVSFQSNCS